MVAAVSEKTLHEERFRRLAAEWKRRTFLLSKISAKVMDDSYQKIIGMGPVAIPFILRDLCDNGPNHWFWALHAITEENPVPEEAVGNIKAMTEAWLQWGREKGYLNGCQTITGQHSQI
jgi:hypothetical protein